VTIHSVVDDLTIVPLGQYYLEMPREFGLHEKSLSTELITRSRWDAVALYELETLGLHYWSTRLAILRPSLNKLEANCGCCSCGGLYCCPTAGECLGCGGCGNCCCKKKGPE
jgi:hypothetical protein